MTKHILIADDSAFLREQFRLTFYSSRKITLMECHDCAGTPVYSRFQNHVVIRIG